MRNSIGSASLPSGPRSAWILSMWRCGCGLYHPMSRPGSAPFFGRDNKSIWRRRMAEAIPLEQILIAGIDDFVFQLLQAGASLYVASGPVNAFLKPPRRGHAQEP